MKTPSRSRMAPSPRAFLDRARLMNLGLGRGQPRYRNGVRRARDVGHPHSVTELDRRRLSTMLPANADLHVRPCPTTSLDAVANQLTDALLVQHGERIRGKELPVQIERQELTDVVA